MSTLHFRLWAGRCLISLVLGINVQSAVVFFASPARYAAGFELVGPAGEAAVLGMAVLFLMWNVPYAVAAVHPRRHRVSLCEALAMQSIGLVGETYVLLTLSLDHVMARAALLRFIAFDGVGLLCLLLAYWLTRRPWPSQGNLAAD